MPKGPIPTVAPTPVPPPSQDGPRLFWKSADGETAKLYLGHVVKALGLIPEKSVQCVVTSPPYWGLRSYTPDIVVLRGDIPEDERRRIVLELESLGVYPTEG